MFSKLFEVNLETLAQENPFLTVERENFDSKTKKWYSNNVTTFHGIAMRDITSSFNLRVNQKVNADFQ